MNFTVNFLRVFTLHNLKKHISFVVLVNHLKNKKMTNLERLQEFANEINRDWTKEYTAIVQDNELRLKRDNELILLLDEKFDIEPMAYYCKDEIEQLNYMIER